jgi:hypothetical protein
MCWWRSFKCRGCMRFHDMVKWSWTEGLWKGRAAFYGLSQHGGSKENHQKRVRITGNPADSHQPQFALIKEVLWTGSSPVSGTGIRDLPIKKRELLHNTEMFSFLKTTEKSLLSPAFKQSYTWTNWIISVSSARNGDVPVYLLKPNKNILSQKCKSKMDVVYVGKCRY